MIKLAIKDLFKSELINKVGKIIEDNYSIKLEDFTQGMEHGTCNTLARVSWKYGASRGVSGTPSYTVNGVFVDSPASLQEWQSILEPLLPITMKNTESNADNLFVSSFLLRKSSLN